MPKKKWGQNFLRNRGAVDRIVAAVEPQAGELIVEIGPGEGVLTEKLASGADEFMAIEIDPELAAKLQQRFGERSAVVVLEPDRKPFASEALIELISLSFRMRRKKLVNNLTSWPREQAVAAIAAAGLAEGVRAEEMGLEEFERLRVALTR